MTLQQNQSFAILIFPLKHYYSLIFFGTSQRIVVSKIISNNVATDIMGKWRLTSWYCLAYSEITFFTEVFHLFCLTLQNIIQESCWGRHGCLCCMITVCLWLDLLSLSEPRQKNLWWFETEYSGTTFTFALVMLRCRNISGVYRWQKHQCYSLTSHFLDT